MPGWLRPPAAKESQPGRGWISYPKPELRFPQVERCSHEERVVLAASDQLGIVLQQREVVALRIRHNSEPTILGTGFLGRITNPPNFWISRTVSSSDFNPDVE